MPRKKETAAEPVETTTEVTASTDPVVNKAKVNVPLLNVRASKSMKAEVVRVLSLGDVVEFTNSPKSKWLELTDGNVILSDFVTVM